MSVKKSRERVGNCSKCGKGAAINTPCLNSKGELICYRCVDDYPEIIQGVEQCLDENGDYVRVPAWYGFGACYHIFNPGKRYESRDAWIGGGRIAFHLTDEEKKMEPLEIMKLLISYIEKKMIRCTRCHKDMKEEDIAGRPLFAGANCKECWELHQKAVEHQRKTGDVCGMCGQPRLNCCC